MKNHWQDYNYAHPHDNSPTVSNRASPHYRANKYPKSIEDYSRRGTSIRPQAVGDTNLYGTLDT